MRWMELNGVEWGVNKGAVSSQETCPPTICVRVIKAPALPEWGNGGVGGRLGGGEAVAVIHTECRQVCCEFDLITNDCVVCTLHFARCRLCTKIDTPHRRVDLQNWRRLFGSLAVAVGPLDFIFKLRRTVCASFVCQ